MCLFVKLIFSVTFVVTKLLTVFSSIRFDEVEFYDPNKTLDESTSNGFVCAHLGEECQITAQCCGVATCALPSWSETSVCLVPGYKHDERFKKRFFSLHNLRPEDIHYIRDSYNTSQYDFLLSDLTFSAPPLDDIASHASSETSAANVTVYNDTVDAFGNLGRDDSADSRSAENVEENSQRTNPSLVEREEENSIKFLGNETLESLLNNTGSVSFLDTLGDSDSINKNFSMNNSTNESQISGFDFKNHFKFLLINNTLRFQDSKLDLKEVYNQIMNTDRFKSIVELLREKMREINEMEKNLGSNDTENNTVLVYSTRESGAPTTDLVYSTRESGAPTTDLVYSNRESGAPTTDLVYSTRESGAPTTETTKITTKISKWDVVKRFFFQKNEIQNNSQHFAQNNITKGVEHEMTLNQIPTVKSQENICRKTVLHTDYPENPNNNEGFKKLIEDVDKLEEIIDNDRTVAKFDGSKKGDDEDFVDFYNINVPLTSREGAKERSGKMNSSLESVFKDIGETIHSMIMKSNDEGKSVQDNLEVEKGTLKNNAPSQFDNIFNETTTQGNDDKTSNKTHFWDKIHFWRVPQNLSIEVERNFKKLFSSGGGSDMREKSKKWTPLNENFILNLNSKNTQETVASLQTERTEKMSEYSSYLSSSESESSGAEDLYNNSYIFIMHNKHFEEPVKLSGWKKVINIFHKEKVVPLSLDVNIHDIPCDSENNHSQTEADSTLGLVKVPEIIRLPEYLMPQVLDKRQGNNTDWIFEDSDEDLEVRTVEEHKTSNRSFFFFLK